MAIKYAEWLSRTGRKGTEADALQWKKSHGVALGLYNPDGTPKPQAAAPAPQVSFADPRLPGIEAERRAVPGSFNDQRRLAAQGLLRNLISGGYFTDGSLAEESVDSGILGADGSQQKNIVYKIIAGANGKLYRQAYETTRDAQNQRGFLESSQTNQTIRDRRGELDRKVNDMFAGLGDEMTGSLQSQREAISRLDSDERGVLSEQAREQAQDPSAIAAPPPPAAAPTVPAAASRTGTPISQARFVQWRQNMGRPALQGTALSKAYSDYVASFKK